MNQTVVACIARTSDLMSHNHCMAAFVEGDLKLYCFCHGIDIDPGDVEYLELIREISADAADIVTDDMSDDDMGNILKNYSKYVSTEMYNAVWDRFKHRDDVSVEMIIH